MRRNSSCLSLEEKKIVGCTVRKDTTGVVPEPLTSKRWEHLRRCHWKKCNAGNGRNQASHTEEAKKKECSESSFQQMVHCLVSIHHYSWVRYYIHTLNLKEVRYTERQYKGTFRSLGMADKILSSIASQLSDLRQIPWALLLPQFPHI